MGWSSTCTYLYFLYSFFTRHILRVKFSVKVKQNVCQFLLARCLWKYYDALILKINVAATSDVVIIFGYITKQVWEIFLIPCTKIGVV